MTKKQYDEKEFKEPFFSKEKKKQDVVKKKINRTKIILEKTNFKMTRLDILYEENERLLNNEK